MLEELADCNLCTVGSHGWSHSYFKNFSVFEAKKDLLSSKKYIEKIINKEINLYAFPYGSFFACGHKNIDIVGNYYMCGFSTVPIPITKPTLLSTYFLPRINVNKKIIKSL